MRRISVSILLIIVASTAIAQYDAILKNPDVTWAAEITLDFEPDPEWKCPGTFQGYELKSIPLKIFNDVEGLGSEWGTMLSKHLENWYIKKGEKGRSWARPEDLKPLSEDEFGRSLSIKDTIEYYDSIAQRMEGKIRRHCDVLSGNNRIRVRQLLYFNQKQGEFRIYTHAIAPIIEIDKGDRIVELTPFWVRLDAQHAIWPDIQSPDIVWAKRLWPIRQPDLSLLKPLKSVGKPVLEQLVNRAKNDPSYQIRDMYHSTDEIISASDRRYLFQSMDTISRFNTETYKDEIQIEPSYKTIENILYLNLVQDWYWDNHRKSLYIRLYAFAPVLKFNRPWFWRKINYWPYPISSIHK